MGISVGVVGASGYAGGELLRLLAGHPDLSVEVVAAGRQAGRLLGEIHPHLGAIGELELASADSADLGGCGLVFLAVPHGESAAIVDTLRPDAAVVDLGADFRLADDEDWSRWYGGDRAGSWTYGLSELPGAREGITASRRIANPGCYATAITLAFAPLIAAGLLAEPAAPVLSVVAASGVSGAGRSPSERLLAAEVMGDLSIYKAGRAHQHIPEIEQTLGGLGAGRPRISMTPILAPMPRGILAVCSATVAAGVEHSQVRHVMTTAYDGEPFVRMLPDGQWPRTSSVLGSNSAVLQVVAEPEAARVVVAVAIDNLGKGAAGQAIQNANLMLGLGETTGLPALGVAP